MGRLLALTVAALALTACDGTYKIAISGGETSVRTFGAGSISGFGSVHVNGIRFRTGEAVIVVDGRVASEADLRLGMVVLVEGTLDRDGTGGTAERIEYAPAVRGTVTAVDPGGELRVGGATIVVDPETTLGPGGIGSGDVIEASGFFDRDDRLHATWIARSSGPPQPPAGLDWTALLFRDDLDVIRISGYVTASSPDRIEIDGLPVDVAATGAVPVGRLVEIEGSLANGVLHAEHIESRLGDADYIGEVVSLDPGSGRLIIEISGGTRIDVAVGLRTQLRDALGLHALRAGDTVSLLGTEGGSAITATHLRRTG